jgi:hypothetical protein
VAQAPDPEVRVRFPALPHFVGLGLERGPLSHVSTIEELLEWKSSWFGLENWEYGRRDPSRSPRGALYPQKLALWGYKVEDKLHLWVREQIMHSTAQQHQISDKIVTIVLLRIHWLGLPRHLTSFVIHYTGCCYHSHLSLIFKLRHRYTRLKASKLCYILQALVWPCGFRRKAT